MNILFLAVQFGVVCHASARDCLWAGTNGAGHKLSRASARPPNPIFSGFEFGTLFLALAPDEIIFIRSLNLAMRIGF